MSFFAHLEARLRQVDSLLCVGLDPHLADLSAPTPAAARDFCLRLVDACADLALAFKPNAAFFEAFGAAGVAVLHEVIQAVPDGIPVILDAKRGDIGSTAEAYARAAFDVLGADALTASPYLGLDSLQPLLQNPEKGVFLLCRTSNPGAADLQELPVSRAPTAHALYEMVALLARQWNTHDNLGLVVGATSPHALQRVRRLAPELWILAPGIGAQGGDLQAALQAGLRNDGLGLLLPVSRLISRAAHPRQAAEALRQALNLERQQVLARASRSSAASGQPPDPRLELADALLQAGCVRFGEFRLKSGLLSPIYLDLRQLVSFPSLLQQAAAACLPLLHSLSFDRLAALPYAALPIGTAISLLAGWPLIYPRKDVKEYGTRAEIEGGFNPGERVVVIDDLTTTGGSKFEAIQRLSAAGLQVQDVVVLIDRQSGARQALSEHGFRLHSVLTLTEMLDHWQHTGQVDAALIAQARLFLSQAAPEG
jgi:uridine monophosphate synthetase